MAAQPKVVPPASSPPPPRSAAAPPPPRRRVSPRTAAAAAAAVHAARSKYKPLFLREVALALSVGLCCATIHKIYHLNLRRKTEEFYDGLERGIYTVVLTDRKARWPPVPA